MKQLIRFLRHTACVLFGHDAVLVTKLKSGADRIGDFDDYGINRLKLTTREWRDAYAQCERCEKIVAEFDSKVLFRVEK